MRKRLPYVCMLIGVVFGLSLVRPQPVFSQITWVRMGVDGMR